MTEIDTGGQIEKEVPSENVSDAHPRAPLIQRLAHENFACTYVYPDGHRCAYARVDPEDPKGRCMLRKHQ